MPLDLRFELLGRTVAATALAAALLFVGSWVARSQRVAEAED